MEPLGGRHGDGLLEQIPPQLLVEGLRIRQRERLTRGEPGRTEYLRRTQAYGHPYAGQIRFTQGVDEQGRPYLDCSDNGIGMGVRELSEVFAQAGVRLGDLPEFIEEQAEWARLEPPVQLFPNSRFGIGVLSYFMLADEITVETCRMGRVSLWMPTS